MTTLSKQSKYPANHLSRKERCRRSGTRSQSGSGIAEGTAGLFVIACLVVAAIIMLVNVGLVSYYRDKIGVVTNHAAGYAASICSWGYSHDASITDDVVASNTASLVNQALREMGLPSGKNVIVQAQKNDNDETVRVTITVNNLRLSGQGNILPLTISLTDSAVATLNNDRPPMLVQLGTKGKSSGSIKGAVAMVPAYGHVTPALLSNLSGIPRRTFKGFHLKYLDSFGVSAEGYADWFLANFIRL